MSRVIAQGTIGYWFLDEADLTPTAETPKTQVVTRTATGGTVDITVAPGIVITGASIVAATTAAGLKAILESSTYIDVGDIAVTGSTGGPFTVTGNIPTLDIDDTNATGGTVTVGSVVEAVAGNQYAPSVVADLTAANRITEALRTATGFTFMKDDVDVPDLYDTYPKTIPGLPAKATPALGVYLNDDPGSKDAIVAARLTEDVTGFIVRSLTTQTPGVGDEVQVWPVRVKSATPSGEADATSASAQIVDVQLTIPATPDLHAICAA